MTDYAATREIRFGVVLYGGVSLAIYINGVVQELFRMVKATAPMPGSEGALRWHDDDLRGSELVYRELGRRLADGEMTGNTDQGIRTRFVVDLLSGTSAGGINGVFLAKALVSDADLGPLQRLWVDKGDIGKLLNDRLANADLRGAGIKNSRCTSFLNSTWMYLQLLKALRSMDSASDAPSPYADALDLWVTTTDLEGRIDVVATSDAPAGSVLESSNRTLIHFMYAPTSDGDEPERNDFRCEDDAMLAFPAAPHRRFRRPLNRFGRRH